MNNIEYQKIMELLKSINRLDLVTKQLSTRSFDEVVNILSMKEWNNPKFKHLLTSNIWKISYEDIKKYYL